MQSVDAVLRQAASDLEAIGARWAVIGGLAVAFRAEPRFTKDVDLAVAVANDEEAEGIINRLQIRGYALASPVEQDYVSRLATARLVRPQVGTSSAFIDLLFANSGIEDEIVRRADLLEVLPDVFMPVASIGHLIALKALAGRHQDLTDLGYLISAAQTRLSSMKTTKGLSSHSCGMLRRSRPGCCRAGSWTAPIRERSCGPPRRGGSTSQRLTAARTPRTCIKRARMLE